MLEKVKQHPILVLLCACIVAFLLVYFGVIDKGDVRSLVHDTTEITHKFKEFVGDIFSKDEHKTKVKSDSTKHKESK